MASDQPVLCKVVCGLDNMYAMCPVARLNLALNYLPFVAKMPKNSPLLSTGEDKWTDTPEVDR